MHVSITSPHQRAFAFTALIATVARQKKWSAQAKF